MNLRSDQGPQKKPPAKLLVIDTKSGAITSFDGKVACATVLIHVDEDTTKEDTLSVLNEFRLSANAEIAKKEAEHLRVHGYAAKEMESWRPK